MKISYNWLTDYIDSEIDINKLEQDLTSIGLEVGGIEKFQSIKGGLEGLVIGEVKTCVPHENSDHLSVTTVDVGEEEFLPIVCGAPNVAAGQKVVVATVGTILYDGDEQFTIKKSKIRGEVSMGMICAEDEIGLGASHDGIMVLDADAKVGTPAKEYFKIEDDYTIEIDLTPNRIDGGGHIGVARDLVAYYKQDREIEYITPDISEFATDKSDNKISVEIENSEACKRYSGVTISGVTIEESPEWLQNRLKAIGLSPINNVVDITNYVLHETCQPLHAFDTNNIKGNKVVVKTMPKGTKFVTLDEVERELHENDLMICNEQDPMCIAGVFGGIESGVKNTTTEIFLESAYFDSVFVRKTARRYGLNTDASFRFERGTDPNGTVYALKRAAMMIKDICGGEITSDIIDLYPESIKDFEVSVKFKNIRRLLGIDISVENIKSILDALEIKIESETKEGLELRVPPYRVDVQREADVIEDILRIYGFNNIIATSSVKSCISYAPKPDEHKVKNTISDLLTANGFNEIMNNSLTKASHYDNLETYKSENLVKIYNPLSSDLNVMRQSLLFGGLENIAYNINRRNTDIRFYEFGSVYSYFFKEENENPVKNYHEELSLGLFITGNKNNETWNLKEQPTNFYTLKTYVENVLTKLGFNIDKLRVSDLENDLFTEGLSYGAKKVKLVDFGLVNGELLKTFDIAQPVYYAEIKWANVFKEMTKNKMVYAEISKFPEVKRDLALLLDTKVRFADIKEIAEKCEKNLLKSVSLFDVYKDETKIGKDKKSYAVSFVLQDENKTLTDKQIDKIMKKMMSSFERQLNAQIR